MPISVVIVTLITFAIGLTKSLTAALVVGGFWGLFAWALTGFRWGNPKKTDAMKADQMTKGGNAGTIKPGDVALSLPKNQLTEQETNDLLIPVGYKLEMLEKAAELENSGNWQEMLIFCKEWAEDEPQNLFAWQGIGDALRKLGKASEAIPMYRKGIEVAPPHPRALMEEIIISSAPLWFRLGKAFSELGDRNKAIEALLEGTRVDPDNPDVAYIWNELGIVYGIMPPCDLKSAFGAFRKAVTIDPENTDAQYNLGILYAVGRGVPQDYKEAVKWYRLAAEQGHADAQYDLGSLYMEGVVPQNSKEAVKWYRLAAEQGHAGAQGILGALYSTGNGISRDIILGYMWLSISSETSDSEKQKIKSIELRDSLAKLMTTDQIAEAQELARKRIANNFKEC